MAVALPGSSPVPSSSGPAFRRALAIRDRLAERGFTAYLAGGCVRDMILGREPKDFDIATDARPDDIQALFPDTRAVGKAFGVVLVILDDQPTEVATFRRDLAYRDGRRPEGVEFSSPEEDAQRRDFTVNGLFHDPAQGRVIDFVGGQEDIGRRVIRAIGDPEARFGEDYLRMLRAIRFAATLEFDLDPTTAGAIRKLSPRIPEISAERIRQELTRMLVEAPRAGRGLRMLRDTGLLAAILPEVDAMAGVEQPPQFHPEGDVFRHTSMMLDALRAPGPVLAYAALLHDVGKPPTARTVIEAGGERIRFDRHDKVGAEMALAILERLRTPAADTEAIVHCVRNHMKFMEVPNMRKATLRRLVGAPTFPDELELHRVDCLCSHRNLDTHDFLEEFVAALRAEPALPAPWVSGHDIMALGIPEGPAVGSWHRKAYEAQLEGRFSSREDGLAWLRKAMAASGGEPMP
jgi:poly(A) polymerase